jgi:enamine deaminase RidA (YjgF/YER057c/UK114 family)
MPRPPRLVELYGPSRTDPIPLGLRLDNLVYAPRVTGVDPASGRLAEGLLPQVEQALANLRQLVEQAGGTLDNLARVTAYVTSVEDREPFYGPWEALFAPPRPACKVLVERLPAGQKVSLQALALLGGARERIDVPGVPARDPTIKIGNLVLTSRVHGTDPATGTLPDELEEQAALAFRNIRSLIELAGGTTRDIAQITAFVRDREHAEVAGRHFASLLPDEPGRPRLHLAEAFIPPNIQIMLEMIGTQGVGAAEAPQELFVDPASAVLPMGLKLGPLILGNNIVGIDHQTGHLADGFERQLRAAFAVMAATLKSGGDTFGQVGHVTVFMRDLDLKPLLNGVWTELYPDPGDRPPHKYVPADLPAGQEVLLNFVAVAGATRRVLEIRGMAHVDPMSMGTTIDGLLFSSRIVGTDTRTGKLGEGAERQAELALENVRSLLQQAGATSAALSQVTAFITGPENLGALDKPWRAMFPDSSARPDLRIVETSLPGAAHVRLEVKATL